MEDTAPAAQTQGKFAELIYSGRAVATVPVATSVALLRSLPPLRTYQRTSPSKPAHTLCHSSPCSKQLCNLPCARALIGHSLPDKANTTISCCSDQWLFGRPEVCFVSQRPSQRLGHADHQGRLHTHQVCQDMLATALPLNSSCLLIHCFCSGAPPLTYAVLRCAELQNHRRLSVRNGPSVQSVSIACDSFCMTCSIGRCCSQCCFMPDSQAPAGCVAVLASAGLMQACCCSMEHLQCLPECCVLCVAACELPQAGFERPEKVSPLLQAQQRGAELQQGSAGQCCGPAFHVPGELPGHAAM